MGRIRSIHPGLATDDEYMGLSHAAARILPLLWCECDDQGVFEWKPRTLKAKLLPAHNDDMEALLDELSAARFVKKIDVDGKSYGLVRNFRQFQRPKKPTITHLLPPEFRTYVGLSDAEPEPGPAQSPPVPHSFPTGGGKSPQMEDGGWRMEDGGGKNYTYAFSGKVIRLNGEDLARWQKSFPNVSGTILGELESRDAWLVTQPPADQKKWFQSTAAHLARLNREAAKPKPNALAGRAVI